MWIQLKHLLSKFKLFGEVDGFDLNVFWKNWKLESIELRVEHTKLSMPRPAIKKGWETLP